MSEQLYLATDDRPEARRSRTFWALHIRLIAKYRELVVAKGR